ncbi:hypothetical protein HBH64_114220 [Parastagonospora nodorum]|nr:hypothetical protein HBH53_138430 [Parastagonospora nodorum]KAH4210697.1 hypothetical protein HBI95_063000 [Parastagonospora nodorum]KAH4305674.1 hypothetical protein HBI01_061230 [Parastagonospora nodorum]KAH4310991.1 hypothetical protein HBI02_095830 [Parastagonospora nodorum]KAH4333117.1 hypothetical protein HBI00_050550 [Parastagonospora nodorum]
MIMGSMAPFHEAIAADHADLLYVDKEYHVSAICVGEGLFIPRLKLEPSDRWRDSLVVSELAVQDVDHINIQIHPYIAISILRSILQLAELFLVQTMVSGFPAGM